MAAAAVDGSKDSKARPTRLVRVNLDSWGRPSCCNARAMPASAAVSRPQRPQWPQLAVPTTPPPGKWSLDWQMAKVWQPLSPTMICNPVIRQPRSYSPVIRWWQARTCYDLRRRLKRRRRGRCSRNKTQWGIWLILIFLTWNIDSKMHKEENRQNIEIPLWQLDFTRKILLRWRRLERRKRRRVFVFPDFVIVARYKTFQLEWQLNLLWLCEINAKLFIYAE